MDFWGKSSGLAGFENTVDRGSAVVFDTHSGLCQLSYVRILSPKRNLDHRSFFILSRYVNEFSQIISFFERSSFKLGCETVIVTVRCFSHHVCCFVYIWAKLTVALTLTSVPFNLFTSAFGCGCGFGFEKKKIGRSTDLAKKRHRRIGGFSYPSLTWGSTVDRQTVMFVYLESYTINIHRL